MVIFFFGFKPIIGELDEVTLDHATAFFCVLATEYVIREDGPASTSLSSSSAAALR